MERTNPLRSLNAPQPIKVKTDDKGSPVAVQMRGTVRRVARVIDHWRIDDEWWRDPLSRMYYRVEYESGVTDTIYHDLISDEWYWQRG